MNQDDNRLKNAVKKVIASPELESRIRSRIREMAQEPAAQIAPDSSQRLKAAVDSVAVPPFLAARVRHSIDSTAPSRTWLPKLVTVGVAAAVLVGVSITYQLGHLRFTAQSQESYISSVSTHIATLMRVGLGDHIECAVFRKYPKKPPRVEEFVQQMAPEYAGLIPIVRKQVPEAYQMTLAHQCRYNGRKFVHLSLMNDSNMLSLVMTRKNPGESFDTEQMLPALTQAGIPMYQAGVQRFQMTAFETRDYMVYFISDLSKQQNTDLMLALAPQVKAFLSKNDL